MKFYEKHRPRSLSEVRGQPKAVATCERMVKAGLGGRVFWISGPSGAGKTTLARILAAEIADRQNVREYPSGRAVSLDEIRGWQKDFGYYAIGAKSGHAVIVNEAHGLSKAAIEYLLGVLEDLPKHVVVIFTTTLEGEERLFEDCIDEIPFRSRCCEVRLTGQGLAQVFAEHVQAIAQAEGLDGQPLEEYVKLARKHKNNCRAMIQAVENGCMVGE